MNVRIRMGVVLVTVALASGCASIPTNGPVQAGMGDVSIDEDIYPIPPQIPEDDPERLVLGFVAASSAGVAGDFIDERTYLSGDARVNWDPFAKITIYGSGDFTSSLNGEAQTVALSLPLVATVDSSGVMTEYEEGTRATATFGVLETQPGRWRISSLDDGIILSEASFSLVFRPVELAFASQDAVVVPDLRWLPRRNTATHATLALVGGPAVWLEDAVQTGLKTTAELAVRSVPVVDGVAEVALDEGSTGGVAERTLALEQIATTLTGLPDVSDVAVTVGGLPIEGDGSLTLSPPPVPSSQAAALVEGRLGMWDGEMMSVVDGGGRVPSGVRDVALSYDGQRVALIVGEGGLAVAPVSSALVPIGEAAPAAIDLPMTTVFEGENLVAPSFDRLGWLWTAEAEEEGLLHVVGSDGEALSLRVPGMEGRDIGGIAVAHDGIRIAILSQEGGVWRLGVAGIVRAADGVPTSVTAPQDVGAGVVSPEALSWVDNGTVAVLGSPSGDEAPSILLVAIGGRTQAIDALPGSVDLSARNGEGSLALVTNDGSLFVRVGIQWSEVEPEGAVLSLAFSG